MLPPTSIIDYPGIKGGADNTILSRRTFVAVNIYCMYYKDVLNVYNIQMHVKYLKGYSGKFSRHIFFKLLSITKILM